MSLLQSCTPAKTKADFIVVNAKAYTVNDAMETAESFAVKDGKFIGVGTQQDMLASFSAEKIIDLSRLPVYPGFNDGHCHFYGYGENLLRYVDLGGTKSFEEIISRLKAHQEQYPSEWILGRGWDQNDWENTSFPDNEAIETVFPGKMVLLIRIDGHASLVSKALLKASGIDRNTHIDGGEIIHNAQGEPSGVLLDNADIVPKSLIPKLTDEEKMMALSLAQNKCFRAGLSSVTDAGLPYTTIELIDRMQSTAVLKMNVNAMLEAEDSTLDHYLYAGPIVKERLTVRSVKLYADGALGSRGAKLLAPYSDDPSQTGLMLFPQSYYEQHCQQAYNAGFQVNTHAIGDSANRLVLQVYAKFLKGKNDLRWRIEHAQLIQEDDFMMFGQYSIIPSIQSTHATSDMYWAGKRVGAERLKGAYAQKRLLDQNGWLVNGTDFPIEHIEPIYTFYAAVSRQDLSGYPEGGFQMENALSREEALRSITIWPAKGAFEEHRKGSIEVGKRADFVVLDKDIMAIPINEIPTAKVKQLYISGEAVLEKD